MRKFLTLLFLGFMSLSASAHEMRPAVATLELEDEGVLRVRLEINLEAWLSGVDPALDDTDDSPVAPTYDRLRALSSGELVDAAKSRLADLADTVRIASRGVSVAMSVTAIEVLPAEDDELPRDTLVRLVGGLPEGADSLTYQVDASLPDTAVRLLLADSDAKVQYVKTGEISDSLSLDAAVTRSWLAIALEYIELGFTHILPKGLDHIVFILGLTLISKRLIDLVLQVTAFTVAHSVTLALGLYGVVNIAPFIVEPLIAASIVYIAVENIWHRRVNVSRTLVVFVFGLLHGLGFAGVLMELGLPQRDFVTGLLAFNIGVELGQLAVIVLAYLAVGVWVLNKSWYRQRVAIPASALIGTIGLFWLVQRVAG